MLNPPKLTLPEGTKIPNHLAIIPDGNRRWAKERGRPSLEGHKKGFDITPAIARAARDFGIHTLTIWAFSTENWQRSKEEVAYLMKLYGWFVDNNLKEAKKDDVRIIHLGRKDRIPVKLAEKIRRAEKETKDNKSNILNIALDYGGHDEILRAMERFTADVQSGKVDPKIIWQEEGKFHDKYPYYFFKEYLDTRGQPYPYIDLLIRTSGEQRHSGLLPWQSVYAEYYWEKDHFPDFTPEKMRAAIIDFSNRHRRFGGN